MINDRHRGSRQLGNDHPILKEDGSQSVSEEGIGANIGVMGTSTAALPLGFPLVQVHGVLREDKIMGHWLVFSTSTAQTSDGMVKKQ